MCTQVFELPQLVDYNSNSVYNSLTETKDTLMQQLKKKISIHKMCYRTWFFNVFLHIHVALQSQSVNCLFV